MTEGTLSRHLGQTLRADGTLRAESWSADYLDARGEPWTLWRQERPTAAWTARHERSGRVVPALCAPSVDALFGSLSKAIEMIDSGEAARRLGLEASA